MQAFLRTLQTMAGQLRGLSSAAKMLIGSLVVIAIMSLFLVSLYARRPALEPLDLGPGITSEARARAISYLQSHDIPYESRGVEILVPAKQRIAVLAQLAEHQVIAADQINFEKLMADDSPFRTQHQNRQRFLMAKMNVLASMISQMSGIERATVVLDQPEGVGGIGAPRVAASASVTVLTRGVDLAQGQVDAIAQLVAGAHAGLKPQNVAIIDARSGRALQARNDQQRSAGQYMEVKLDTEKYVKATLESALNYIPGVRVAVNAQVDTSEVVEHTSTYDEPKVGVVEDSNRTVTTSGAPPAAEAGLLSNTGFSITNNNAGSQLSDERTDTSTIPVFGRSESQKKNTKGYALQINATIGVPKSYFVRLAKDRKASGTANAEGPEFDGLVQEEIQKIRSHITPLIDTKAMEGAVAGVVAVNMIQDFAAATWQDDAPEFPLPNNIASAAPDDNLVKYVSLGGLAALSLGMMFFMVRRAGTRSQAATSNERVGGGTAAPPLDEPDFIDQVDEGAPALDGVELDDDAIRRSQMLDQINAMVDHAPKDAAYLLRRWIRSEA